MKADDIVRFDNDIWKVILPPNGADMAMLENAKTEGYIIFADKRFVKIEMDVTKID